MRAPAWLVRAWFACLVCVAASGCERAPGADSLPEWTPKDHHSQDDDKLSAAQSNGRAQAKGTGEPQLVDVAWRQQCTSCHGPLGHGDGPMGPMVKAPDLSSGDWQGKVTDAEIGAVITGGRNRMPKFDLPEPVVRGLVARIRTLRGP